MKKNRKEIKFVWEVMLGITAICLAIVSMVIISLKLTGVVGFADKASILMVPFLAAMGFWVIGEILGRFIPIGTISYFLRSRLTKIFVLSLATLFISLFL